jgi:hypothetical protein
MDDSDFVASLPTLSVFPLPTEVGGKKQSRKTLKYWIATALRASQ